MRLLVVVVAVGCKTEARITTCADVELAPASAIADAHPCRARLEASADRVMRMTTPSSGALVSTRVHRGAGVLVTCQHCVGAGAGLLDPERDPVRIELRVPRTFAHRLFSPPPPPAAFDSRGDLTAIEPRVDFVIATLHDPLAMLAQPWADPRPGTQAMLLGFPSDRGGELVASVGEVLDDARAKDMLARSDPDEAAIAYDPAIELVVAARAVHGMSGGGAFDPAGHYLGVLVRGTLAPVDGRYLTRIVRARHVFAQLDEALAASPLGAKLAPLVR